MNNINPQNIFNQNMNNNNNILNNNINILTKETIPKEYLARRDYETYAEDKSPINCEKLNIRFCSNTGVNTIIVFSRNKTINELFIHYAKVMGIDENLLGGEIVFLYNAETLNIKDQRPICDKFVNNSLITVVDIYFIVGG